MTYAEFNKDTAYSNMVFNCVSEWSQAVVGELTLREFADMCGFSVTHNLRRRIKNMVDHEILVTRFAQSEDGRWIMKYQPTETFRNTVRQSKLPF